MSTAPAIAATRIGRARVKLMRWLRKSSLVAALSPALFALIEVVAHPWNDQAFHALWPRVLAVGPLAAVALALGAIAAYGVSWREQGGSIAEDADGLRLERGDGVRIEVPRADVASGVVVPRGDVQRVEIELKSGDRVHADVQSPDDADRILAAAGVDAEHRRARIAG